MNGTGSAVPGGMKRALLALVLVGCVSQGKYDAAVAHSSELEKQLVETRAGSTKKDTRIDDLQKRVADLDAKARERNRLLLATGEEADDLARKLDAAMLLNASLKEELAKLGKDTDDLESQNSALSQSLESMRAKLDELRRMQAAAELRAALFHDVASKLKRMVDDGNLSIVVREGRMVLALPNEVLFDTGRTEIKPAGQDALRTIAGVIKTMTARQFQISGHTDNVPIHNAKFASNWELSAGRALEVVHFLINQGVEPKMLSAAGYGEMDNVATNDSAEGRKKNRRTEITLQPNIDEIVAIPPNR